MKCIAEILSVVHRVNEELMSVMNNVGVYRSWAMDYKELIMLFMKKHHF